MDLIERQKKLVESLQLQTERCMDSLISDEDEISATLTQHGFTTA